MNNSKNLNTHYFDYMILYFLYLIINPFLFYFYFIQNIFKINMYLYLSK